MARLKGAKRQNNQLQLSFGEATKSEARSQSSEETEASVAECSAESLALVEQWMERICQRENLWQALKRLRKNGGSPGLDGMTVDDLTGYLKQHWIEIREQRKRPVILSITHDSKAYNGVWSQESHY